MIALNQFKQAPRLVRLFRSERDCLVLRRRLPALLATPWIAGRWACRAGWRLFVYLAYPPYRRAINKLIRSQL